jgi:cytoplasmic iron level regulating protein YaaA (DUF328/UPF0246 family)
MIILLSPAKSLDFERDIGVFPASQPRFTEDTKRLVTSAARLSKKRLQDIMPVSDRLVDLNYKRYRDFFDQPERPAILAFNGDVYQGFEAASLDAPALDFAQDHVRILSGLYGLLRPFDAIRPYRLEMGTKWAPRHKSLVDFWGDKLAKNVAAEMGAIGTDTIINCASQEYFAAVKPGFEKRKLRVINIDFRQDGPDGPRFQSFAAKRARGMMARYACEHRLSSPEALKSFDSDGYQFNPETSDDTVWRFVRA